MSVGHMCQRPACTVLGLERVKSAAIRMDEEQVGALVVVEDERPVGMLTDRDLVVRVVAEGRRAGDTRVSEVASAPVVALPEDASLQSAVGEMSSHGTRRMPVVDAKGHIAGLLAADDLVRLAAAELSALADVASEQSPMGRRVAATGASELRDAAHYAKPVVTVDEASTACAVATTMRDEGVGCVIVVDTSDRPCGVLTDRDLARRVVAPDLDPGATAATAVMSPLVHTIEASEPLQRVVAMMSENGVRRIPVVRDGKLFGIVTYDDVLVALGGELRAVGEAALRARSQEAGAG